MWRGLRATIDINYLINYILNKEQKLNIKPILKYKPIEHLSNNNKPTKTINNKYLLTKDNDNNNLSYTDFLINDTLIIKSCTGTGKTSTIAKHIKEYIKTEPRTRIISLITRRTLEPQHQKNFKENDIKLTSYLDDEKDITMDHMIICINSLVQHKDTKPEEFNNCIVLIDEISSFSKALTHNETINGERKIIYSVINKLINNCKKLIVMDAHINDGVFNLIESRATKNKLFINNTFQKYQGVNAINIKDEKEFINMMTEESKQNNLFVLGSDSATEAKKIYYKCLEDNKDNNDKFELITADSGAIVNDATTQYENNLYSLVQK
jgi:hypothetical protein